MKALKPGKLSPVFVRIYRGKQFDFKAQTGQLVDPADWNPTKGRVKNTLKATYKDQVNGTLDELEVFLKKELIQTSEYNREWLESIIEKFYRPDLAEQKGTSLFQFIEKFIDEAPKRVNHRSGEAVGYKQIREYNATFNHLKEYASEKRQKIDFKDINMDFYHDFIRYLETDKETTDKKGEVIIEPGLKPNTIGKKIQVLKIFLNSAVDEGLTTNTQFRSRRFAQISEDVDSVYLNETELTKLWELDLKDNPRLDKVRDLFLIGCWTGLRFGNWKDVNFENIKDGFLHIRNEKTRHTNNQKVVIPVHPVVNAILTKYDGILPKVISNQKLNTYIKELCQKAGIDEPTEKTERVNGVNTRIKVPKYERIGTHTGRRSFASNAYLRGIPSISIMAITNHNTEKSFLKYIRLSNDQHAQKFKELWAQNIK